MINFNKKIKIKNSQFELPEWYSQYHNKILSALNYASKDRITKVQIAANETIKYMQSKDEINDDALVKMNKLNLLRNLSKLKKDKNDDLNTKNYREEIYTNGIDSLIKTCDYLRSRNDSAIKLMKISGKRENSLRRSRDYSHSSSLLKSFRNHHKNFGNKNKDGFEVMYNERVLNNCFSDEYKIINEKKCSKDSEDILPSLETKNNNLFVEEIQIGDNLEYDQKYFENLPIERSSRKYKTQIFKKNSELKEINNESEKSDKLNNECDPNQEKQAKENYLNYNLKKASLEVVYLDSFCFFKNPSPILKLEKYINNDLEYAIHNKVNNIEIKRVVEFSIIKNTNFYFDIQEQAKNYLISVNIQLNIQTKKFEEKFTKMKVKLDNIKNLIKKYQLNKTNMINRDISESLNLSEISYKNLHSIDEQKDKLRNSFSNRFSKKINISNSQNKFPYNEFELNIISENPLIKIWLNILKELENNNKSKAFDDALKVEDDLILLRLLFLTGPCLENIETNIGVKLVKRINTIYRCHMFQNLVFLIIKKSVDCKIFEEIDDFHKNEILETLQELSTSKITQEYAKQSSNLYNFILSQY